jgi:trans-2-enoyl-CoA reductase
MSDKNESVNSQVTDAVTQTNVKVLGEAPAMAMGNLYQTIGNSVAMAASNAVYAQQQANITYQAATTLGVQTLLSGRTATASTKGEAFSDDHIDTLIDELKQQIDHLNALKTQSASADTKKKSAKNVKK